MSLCLTVLSLMCSNVLKTKEFSPLEPDVSENKYYAANVGEIKEKLSKAVKKELS